MTRMRRIFPALDANAGPARTMEGLPDAATTPAGVPNGCCICWGALCRRQLQGTAYGTAYAFIKAHAVPFIKAYAVPQYYFFFSMTPQARRGPALPVGWVWKSSS